MKNSNNEGTDLATQPAEEGDGQSRVSFTPGPWRAAERLSGSENHKGWRIVTAKGYAVGEVYPLNEDPSPAARANARLIAAAPTLYTIGQKILAKLDSPTESVTAIDADELRAALAAVADKEK